MSIYTPYTYLIGWSKLNKWYYGVRFGKNCHPNDLWITYFSSSKVVQEYRILYGEPDIIQVRKTFNCSISAQNWEVSVLKRLRVVKNEKWLNNAVPGTYIISEEIKKKLSLSLTGKQKSEEHRKNISKGRKGIQFSKEHKESIRNAVLGTKQSEETKRKRGDVISTLKWFNNGVMNTRCLILPGPEWKPGRIKGFRHKKKRT